MIKIIPFSLLWITAGLCNSHFRVSNLFVPSAVLKPPPFPPRSAAPVSTVFLALHPRDLKRVQNQNAIRKFVPSPKLDSAGSWKLSSFGSFPSFKNDHRAVQQHFVTRVVPAIKFSNLRTVSTNDSKSVRLLFSNGLRTPKSNALTPAASNTRTRDSRNINNSATAKTERIKRINSIVQINQANETLSKNAIRKSVLKTDQEKQFKRFVRTNRTRNAVSNSTTNVELFFHLLRLKELQKTLFKEELIEDHLNTLVRNLSTKKKKRPRNNVLMKMKNIRNIKNIKSRNIFPKIRVLPVDNLGIAPTRFTQTRRGLLRRNRTRTRDNILTNIEFSSTGLRPVRKVVKSISKKLVKNDLKISTKLSWCPKLYGSLELICEVTNYQDSLPLVRRWSKKQFKPNITTDDVLTKGANVISEDPRVSVLDTKVRHILRIERFRMEDSGAYECHFQNEHSTAKSQIMVLMCL